MRPISMCITSCLVFVERARSSLLQLVIRCWLKQVLFMKTTWLCSLPEETVNSDLECECDVRLWILIVLLLIKEFLLEEFKSGGGGGCPHFQTQDNRFHRRKSLYPGVLSSENKTVDRAGLCQFSDGKTVVKEWRVWKAIFWILNFWTCNYKEDMHHWSPVVSSVHQCSV